MESFEIWCWKSMEKIKWPEKVTNEKSIELFLLLLLLLKHASYQQVHVLTDNKLDILFFDFHIPLTSNIFFSFSNHQGTVSLLPIQSSVLQWHHSQNMTRMLFRSILFSPIRSINFSLFTFSDHFIIFILLQPHILKLSQNFWYNFF